MATDLPLLQVNQVTASRPGERGMPQTVVKQASLEVHPGEVVVVVGPSGSGKSTLLRLCNRLMEPDSGQVLFAGQDVRTQEPPVLRRQVALVAQKPYLYQGTVRSNLAKPADLQNAQPPDLSSPSYSELLTLCQVDTDWLDRDGRRLSIGQQQRVCLARALMGNARLLLLDEPTSALDRPTAEALAKTFRALVANGELGLLLVTHDLRIAELCADRVLVMIDGRIVEEGPAVQVLTAPQDPAVREFVGQPSAPRSEETS